MKKYIEVASYLAIVAILGGLAWISATKKTEEDGPSFRGRPASYWGRAIKAVAADERSAITISDNSWRNRLLFPGRSRESGEEVWELLYGKDPTKIPAQTWLLQHPDPVVRSHAAYGFGHSFEGSRLPGAEAAIPSLIDCVHDEYPYVRQSAIGALKEFGPRAYDAVPALVKALHDSDERVRSDALYCLGAIGPKARDAVPAVVELLKSPNHRVRATAAYALGGIGPDAKQAVPLILQLMDDECMDVRDSAYYALETNDPALYEKRTGQKPRPLKQHR